jgi:hypothetical protein
VPLSVPASPLEPLEELLDDDELLEELLDVLPEDEELEELDEPPPSFPLDPLLDEVAPVVSSPLQPPAQLLPTTNIANAMSPSLDVRMTSSPYVQILTGSGLVPNRQFRLQGAAPLGTASGKGIRMSFARPVFWPNPRHLRESLAGFPIVRAKTDGRGLHHRRER